MSDAVLALNAGSSSLKFSLFDVERELTSAEALAHGSVSGMPHEPRVRIADGSGALLEDRSLENVAGHEPAMAYVLGWIDRERRNRIVAVGHRVVHGGARFLEPVVVDDAVLAQLKEYIPMAPLHQPHNLAAIKAFKRLHPRVPQVACFDTAFHHTQPPLATQFALPEALSARGIRRYGFHGLSYEYIASVLPSYLGELAEERVIVAHLGSGASMCAMRYRRSVATTMGFTALDGLMMGTRCGAIDPGVVLYLLDSGMSGTNLCDLLWEQSGLLGVSGVSDDMRELLASTSPSAAQAIDLFAYRIVREVGSLAAALGGLDALVFTAGIGENVPSVRRAVCAQLAWLGVHLNGAANDANARQISDATGSAAVWVIPTDEEAIVARHVVRLLRLDANSA
jgi:acetate kinase